MSAALLSLYSTPPTSRRRRLRAISTPRDGHALADRPRARPRSTGGRKSGDVEVRPSDYCSPTRQMGVSELRLDTTCMCVGDGKRVLVVDWNIVERVSLLDWVAMYLLGEADPFNYLESKNYGTGARHHGRIKWRIGKRMFREHGISSNQVRVCFKYFDGVNGAVRAVSEPLVIRFKAEIDVPMSTGDEVTARRVLITALHLQSQRLSGAGSLYVKTTSRRDTHKTVGIDESAASWQWHHIRIAVDSSDVERTYVLHVKSPSSKGPLAIASFSAGQCLAHVARGHGDITFVLTSLPQYARTLYRRATADIGAIVVSLAHILPEKHSRRLPDSRGAVGEDENGNEVGIVGSDSGISHDAHSIPNSNSTASSHSSSGPSPSSTSGPALYHSKSPRLRRPARLSLADSPESESASPTSHEPPGEAALPDGWEAREDSHGRVFYVDHATKTTTWTLPVASHARHTSHVLSLMERRYACSRRATSSSDEERAECTEAESSEWPAIAFIARHDALVLIEAHDAARYIYEHSPTVRHILDRVRRDPAKFEKYQHDGELVAMLNELADTTAPLPAHWSSKTDAHRRTLFVDHQCRRTTFIDPRLPVVAPPVKATKEMTDDELVHVLRTANLARLLRARVPSAHKDDRVWRALATIRRDGVGALPRFASDEMVQHALRQVGRGRGHSSSFERRLASLHAQLERRGYGAGPSTLTLNVRRDTLLVDTFTQLLAPSRRQLQRGKLRVVFDAEDGLDYGGPSKEFFFLLSRELFNPYYGLFEYSANDRYTVQLSPMSVFVDDYIEWWAMTDASLSVRFHVCGRVLGLALIHRYLVDAFFTTTFYKMLLGRPTNLADLQSLDASFHSSLLWIRENPVTDELDLTFSVNEMLGGRLVERELIASGASITVTDENKLDYVDRMARWRVERGVQRQAASLVRGFHDVVDPALLTCLGGGELEMVLCGTVELDVVDWRANTEYKGGYESQHVVCLWFWQAVHSFSNAQRLLLLQFATGTSSIPVEGFAGLRGSHGARRFALERWGTPDSLPRAHTCFNRLDLPSYPTYSILRAKLLLAIQETDSYAIE